MEENRETKIGEEEARKALAILEKYKQGKKTLNQRLIDNEEWWRMRHWERFDKKNTNKEAIKPASAWLINSLMNKHERIHSVLVPSISHFGVVLRCIEYNPIADLTVMQNRLCDRHPARFSCYDFFVIPVYYQGLSGVVHIIICQIVLYTDKSILELPLHLWIRLFDQVVVHHIEIEQISGVLNIVNSRLPVHFERVAAPDRYISQTVLLL